MSGSERGLSKPTVAIRQGGSFLLYELLRDCGTLLRRKGYRIKVLNTVNFSKSMHYNPFAYLRSESDILKLVMTLIANTTPSDKKGGDAFWERAETLGRP